MSIVLLAYCVGFILTVQYFLIPTPPSIIIITFVYIVQRYPSCERPNGKKWTVCGLDEKTGLHRTIGRTSLNVQDHKKCSAGV